MKVPQLRSVFRDSALFADVEDTLIEQLLERVTEVRLPAGEALFQQGDTAEALYIVIEGTLEAIETRADASARRLGLVQAGDPVGELAVLLDTPRGASVRALEDSRLARLTADDLAPLLWKSAAFQAALEAQVQARIRRNELLDVLERLLGEVEEGERRDFSDRLEWVALQAGDILFRRGDPGDSLYIVIRGELWAVGQDSDGEEVPIASLASHDVVGEMGLLSDQPRSAAVVAAKPSLLVRLSRSNFEILSAEYPRLMLSITRQLIGRLQRSQRKRQAARGGCRRIVVMGAEPDVALDGLLADLAAPLGSLASHISPAFLSRSLGLKSLSMLATDDPRSMGVSLWLDEQAAQADILLLQAESWGGGELDAWSRFCLSDADEVLLVSRTKPAPESEKLLAMLKTRCHPGTRYRLLCLHDTTADTARPAGPWLDLMKWDSHYHARESNDRDLARVARLIARRGVGLVLGGSGPGALLQWGGIQALEEKGLPIDTVVATGVAAAAGALYASRGFAAQEPRFWDSLRWGHCEPAHMKQVFNDLRLEDTWCPLYCASANLAEQSLRAHRHGSLTEAVHASLAVPGMDEPVFIDGANHFNGGLLNPMPVELLPSHIQFAVGMNSFAGPSGQVPGSGDSPASGGSLGQRLAAAIRAFRHPESHAFQTVRSKQGDFLMEILSASGQQSARRTNTSLDLSLSLPVDMASLDSACSSEDLIDRGYQQVRENLEQHNLDRFRESILALGR